MTENEKAESLCYVEGTKPLKGGRYYHIDSVFALPNSLAQTNEAQLVIKASMLTKTWWQDSHTTISLNLAEDDAKILLASIVKVVKAIP